MGKLISGKTLIHWIEKGNTVLVATVPTEYDPANPRLGHFSSATDISCAIASGYSLNPTKSDVNTARTICEEAESETPVRYNYEGNLTFFREGDLAETTSAFARAFSFFGTGRKEGYLVRRSSIPRTTALAVGQKVDSFKFISDMPQDTIDDDLIQFMTKFLPQGHMELNKAIVA